MWKIWDTAVFLNNWSPQLDQENYFKGVKFRTYILFSSVYCWAMLWSLTENFLWILLYLWREKGWKKIGTDNFFDGKYQIFDNYDIPRLAKSWTLSLALSTKVNLTVSLVSDSFQVGVSFELLKSKSENRQYICEVDLIHSFVEY